MTTGSDKRVKMLSFRVSEEELARVKAVAAEVKKKNRYVQESDVLRELLGLENTGIITPKLRAKLAPPTAEIVDE